MPDVNVMLPPALMRGAACWTVKNGPRIFDRTPRMMLSSVRLRTGPYGRSAAVTTTCRSAPTCSNSAPTAACSPMSTSTASTPAPSSARAAASRSADRPAITTVAPSARQRRATSRPIPELPPMTTTVSLMRSLDSVEKLAQQTGQLIALGRGEPGEQLLLAAQVREQGLVDHRLALPGETDQLAAAIRLV